MAGEANDPYLKYALFCKDTKEDDGGDLNLNGIIDLFELPEPDGSADPDDPVLATVDVNLVFCVGGAEPGDHYLFVTLKTPGIPLETPRPKRRNGRRAYCSNVGSRPSASQCSTPASIRPRSCSMACPWARPPS